MGKSSKKIKSDKINALRKQYDSFLEEDKRRRDRNEYILGHLEKMRSTDMLAVRYKEKPQHRDYIYPLRRRPESLNKFTGEDDDENILSRKNVLLKANCPINLGESSILNEISKKYILIPKLQLSPQNNVTYYEPSFDNPVSDTNWKSKYNILNELKKNEKETDFDEKKFDVVVNEDGESKVFANDSQSKKNNELPTIHNNMQNYETKMPSHDSEPKKPDINKNNINESNANEFDENINSQNPNGPTITDDIIKCTEKKVDLLHDNITNQYEHKKNINEIPNDNNNKNEINKQDLILHKTVINDDDEYKNNKQFDFSKGDIESQDILYENNIDKVNGEREINKTIENPTSHKNLEGIIKKEFSTEEEINIDKKDLSLDKEELVNNKHDVVPKDMQENAEIISDNNSILKDTEHKSIENNYNIEQYSEETIEVSPEKEQISYAEEDKAYEQNNDTTEQLLYQTDNENYINEGYAYYDESQQQQPYTGEIIEHEVATDQYGPNCEQQYGSNYVDPNLTQYQNQQYEVDNSYEQQQGEETNINYEGHPDNTNYEFINSEKIEVTNENQDGSNIYNYENQESQDNISYENQQYDGNVQQIYSTIPNELDHDGNVQQIYSAIPNEQDQYGEQPEYNLIEPNAIGNMEKLQDICQTENTNNVTEEDYNASEEISEKFQSDLTTQN